MQPKMKSVQATLYYIMHRWNVRFHGETLLQKYNETFDTELLENPQEKSNEFIEHFTQLFQENVYEPCMNEIVDDALRNLIKDGHPDTARNLAQSLEALVLEKLATCKCPNIRKLLYSILEPIYESYCELDPYNLATTCHTYLSTVDFSEDSAPQMVLEMLKALRENHIDIPQDLVEHIKVFFTDPRFIARYSHIDFSGPCKEGVFSEFLSHCPGLQEEMIAVCGGDGMEEAIAQEVEEVIKLVINEHSDVSEMLTCNDKYRETQWSNDTLKHHETLSQLVANPELETIIGNFVQNNVKHLVSFLKRENAPKE